MPLEYRQGRTDKRLRGQQKGKINGGDLFSERKESIFV